MFQIIPYDSETFDEIVATLPEQEQDNILYAMDPYKVKDIAEGVAHNIKAIIHRESGRIVDFYIVEV